MLADELTRFCNERFRASCSGHCGTSCTNPAECPGSCDKCLDQIHFDGGGRRDYDCVHLIDFYVCRYTHKYASEILYMLRKSSGLSKMDSYNILSIGCGGCSDLAAFDRFAGSKDFSYLGIDLNFLWQDVHSFILDYKAKSLKRVRFAYGNALEYMKNNYCFGFNVMVLNYVISTVNSTGSLEEFYTGLIKHLFIDSRTARPFVILINDVNHPNGGRDTFEVFVRWLKNFHELKACRYYFPYKNFPAFGESHRTCELLYSPPPYLSGYGLRNCTSAQMLIELL